MHALFKAQIREHRPQVDVEQIATGEHWYGVRALELKLVDELRTSDDFLMEAAKEHDLYHLRSSAGARCPSGCSRAPRACCRADARSPPQINASSARPSVLSPLLLGTACSRSPCCSPSARRASGSGRCSRRSLTGGRIQPLAVVANRRVERFERGIVESRRFEHDIVGGRRTSADDSAESFGLSLFGGRPQSAIRLPSGRVNTNTPSSVTVTPNPPSCSSV